jgi:hypothetical protein
MAIKRYTFEIDDTLNAQSSTGVEIQKRPIGGDVEKNQTRSVEAYGDAEIPKTDDLSPNKPTVGRTIGDIIVEFKDDRRLMTIVLIFVSFLIFVSKIDSISNFLHPLILALLLNIIYHSFPYIEKRIARTRQSI